MPLIYCCFALILARLVSLQTGRGRVYRIIIYFLIRFGADTMFGLQIFLLLSGSDR